MTAKEYLQQARFLDEQINEQIQSKRMLYDMATNISPSISDMPGSPNRNTDKIERTIVKMIDMEQKITENIDKLVDLKAEIEGVIAAIEDVECRLVLHKRYVGMKSWQDIAYDMGYGLDNVYKIHGKALEKVIVPETVQ